MEVKKPFYRKNFTLIISFIVLISLSFILALILAYSLTSKNVENDFSSKKIETFERIIEPYNDFFQNSIPEISYYQGYLDSASARKYVSDITAKYPFVQRAIFYDTEISNHQLDDGLRAGRLALGPKAVYQFGKSVPKDSVILFKNNKPNSLSLKTADEFNKMAIKFSGFIETADTTKALSNDQIFSTFYSIYPNRITYLNIPRREEISIFQDLMLNDRSRSPVFEKDMFSFWLNPARLPIINSHPELYQQIKIVPVVYELLGEQDDQLTTEIALPGPFSGYKLFLSSSPGFHQRTIFTRFLPIAGLLCLIYAFLMIIAYLIYRNLYINEMMFKLQYDFINNLTHEFKTPVSVIKVAGNTIGNSTSISDKERLHYAKILDEEADKLNNLMNRLLSFTQIENKAIQLHVDEIDLELFCQKRKEAYELDKPDYQISFSIAGLKYFKTDSVLLSSIFNNLMDNAYKYSEPGRKSLRIEIVKTGEHISFKFIDEGIGISKEDQKHIFQKFYRIENRYNQQGSVGLGLAFCKELVNFMNGSISVKSQLGKGSVFTIQLPYQE